MMNYKDGYLLLFNAATDALAFMQQRNFEMARRVLVRARREAEESVISQPGEEDEVAEEAPPSLQ